MCLDSIQKFEPCSKGWKAVDFFRDNIVCACSGNDRPLEVGKWLSERNFRDEAYVGQRLIRHPDFSYPFGFHVWHTKRAAIHWAGTSSHLKRIVKVEVSDPRCTGLQNGSKVTVAKRIKIIKVYRGKSYR